MRKLLSIFIFISITLFTSSVTWALPGWILPELKKYPAKTYLRDIGMAPGEEAFKNATAAAHRKVAERILRKVSRIIRYNHDELAYDMVREHYSAVLEDYCSWRQVLPALKLEGLKVRNLTVDMARQDDKETYSLIYIKRDELKKLYAAHALKLREEIKQQLRLAKREEDLLNREGAIRAYLKTYPLYAALKEAEIIQIGAEYMPNFRQAFRQLATAATKIDGKLLPHRNVIKRVEELAGETIVTFNDVCLSLISQLLQQTDEPSGSVSLHPLIYEDSEMISSLASVFTDVLRKEFSWAVVVPVREFKQTPIDTNKINQVRPPWRLSPSFWENGDEITLRVTLRNTDTGEFRAGAVVRFLHSKLRDGDKFTYRPRGYEKAKSQKKAFEPRYYRSEPTRDDVEAIIEHQFVPIDGLKVEVWTGEGPGPLHYTKDDRLKIYVRVNQAAYIRLLYTLADGRRILLKDSHYIDPEEVNGAVEIGEFVCTPPFGIEFLNVAARTDKFPPIETREEDGYHLLINQDAEKAAELFRGLKPVEKTEELKPIEPPLSDEQPRFQQSEVQLMITTTEK